MFSKQIALTPEQQQALFGEDNSEDEEPSVPSDVTCTTQTVPGKLGSASLNWGVKSSFVKYVEGPIGNGSITTSNGAARSEGGITWGSGSGSLDAAGVGTLTFPGAVRFTAHDGVLDVRLSNVQVKTTDGNSGTLVAVAKSQDMAGNVVTDGEVTLADLSFDSLSSEGGTATATLTEEGAQAFVGFYEVGSELDSLNLVVTAAIPETEVEVCVDADGNPVNPDGTPIDSDENEGDDDNGQGEESGTGGNGGSSAGGSATEEGGTKATENRAKEIFCTTETVPATPGTPRLTWGIKSSFVSYIQGGIANGSISTSNGASRSGGGFGWGAGSGSFTDAGIGTLRFPGAVHLTGHGGILDVRIANLQVRSTGGKSGTLVGYVRSQDMSGNVVTNGTVTLANLRFASLSASGGTASATLTSAGAQAFAGFYNAGDAMDNLTVSITGAQGERTVEVCYDADGNRVNPDGTPYTGDDDLALTGLGDTGGLLALVGALTLSGAALLITRRHRAHR